MDIKLAGTEKLSTVDGPGLRYTIFTQGCVHNCKDCHNPNTHNYSKGYQISIDNLLKDIEVYDSMISGLTLSGGDPLYILNYEPVLELCKMYKEKYPHKNIWLYTGYTYEEVLIIRSDILRYIDILVDGPFVSELRIKPYDKLLYKGSSNQRIINVKDSIKCNKVKLVEFDS